MTIFAIIAPGRSDVLKAAVERVFPDKNFEFAPGQFVAVTSGMTSQQVASALGANGEVGKYQPFPSIPTGAITARICGNG